MAGEGFPPQPEENRNLPAPINGQEGGAVAVLDERAPDTADGSQPGTEAKIYTEQDSVKNHPNYYNAADFRDAPREIGSAGHIVPSANRVPTSESPLGPTFRPPARQALGSTPAVQESSTRIVGNASQPEIEDAKEVVNNAEQSVNQPLLTPEELTAAEDTFRDKGEEGYVQYVEERLAAKKQEAETPNDPTAETAPDSSTEVARVGSAIMSGSVLETVKNGEPTSDELAEALTKLVPLGQDPMHPEGAAPIGAAIDALIKAGDREGAAKLAEDLKNALNGKGPETPVYDLVNVRELQPNGETENQLGNELPLSPDDINRIVDRLLEGSKRLELTSSASDANKKQPEPEKAPEKTPEQAELETEFEGALEDYMNARDKYLELSAQKRGGHLGTLAAPKTRLGRVLRNAQKVVNAVTHPIDAVKTMQFDKKLNEARLEYTAASRIYSRYKIEATPTGEQRVARASHEESVLNQLARRDVDDAKVVELQAANAQSSEVNSWLAQNWINTRGGKYSSRATKIFKVALPAAAFGAVTGFAVAAVSPVAAIFAASYAGGEIAKQYAKRVNKYAITHEAERARLDAAVEARGAAFREQVAREGITNPYKLDISQSIERGNDADSTANRQRLNRMVTVGRAVGGLMGRFGASEMQSLGVRPKPANAPGGNNSDQPLPLQRAKGGHTGDGPLGGGRTTAPNPVPTAKAANIPTNTVPWETAHKLAEQGLIPKGHEMNAVQQEIGMFNKTHSPVELGPNGNGFEAVRNVVTKAAQTPGSQTTFDKGMIEDVLSGNIRP